MGNMLEVKDLSFSYSDKSVFKKLSFDIKKGEFISFLGSNNGGKTTLIKLLSGLLPSENNIVLDNVVLNKRNGKKYLRNIGVIFSDIDRQFLSNNPYDELCLVLKNLNYSKEKIKQQIEFVADELDISHILDINFEELGAFEKARVLVAVSLIHKPKIIFIDDLLSNLEAAETRVMGQFLKKMATLFDITIVTTSSNLEDALYADRVILIDKGVLQLDESFDDILKKDNRLAKAGIVIPKMIDISLKLQFYDLLNEVILDEKELVRQLWK